MDHASLMSALEHIRGSLERGSVEEALALLDELSARAEESVDFQQVVDSLLDGMYITDQDAVTRYVNPAYCKHMGIMPQEVLGRSVTEIAKEGALFQKSVSEDVIKLGRNVTGTGITQDGRGRSVPTYVTGVPIFDEQGRVKNVAVSVFDTDALMYRVTEFRKTVHVEQAVKILDRVNEHEVSVMVGEAPAIREIRRTIARAAPTDVTILITGESGVGKEVIADRIYYASDRQGKPFVKVNCTAIPANLLESELFGHEKGSFTGAVSSKVGLFEMANHGTILLDEIGEFPLSLQPKLLRVLQEKEIRRVGGTKTIPIDVRVIAATNQNLLNMVKDNTFRTDLYYRLNVFPIKIPPLRERPEDVPPLASSFLSKFNKKYKKSKFFTPQSVIALERYSWPGNVRELENIVERLVIVGNEPSITASQVEYIMDFVSSDGQEPPCFTGFSDLKTAVDMLEKQMITDAFNLYKSTYKAAKALGTSQSTIVRKMRMLGIEQKK